MAQLLKVVGKKLHIDDMIFDFEKHYLGKYLGKIAEDVNKFLQEYPQVQKYYVDALRTSKKTKLFDPLKHFCYQIDKQLSEFINKHGYKVTEKAKTDLFMEQDEINLLLKITMRCKLIAPYIAINPAMELESIKAVAEDGKTLASKLYKLVMSRVTPFKHGDTAAWNFLRIAMFDNIEVYGVILLSFIQTRILILCDIDKNPITYILSVASDCMKWMSYGSHEISGEVPEKPVFTVQQVATLSLIAKMRQKLYAWLRQVDKLSSLIDNASLIGPAQQLWYYLCKPHGLKQLDAREAAVVSMYCSQALQRIDGKIAEKCPHLLEVSMWVPYRKTQSSGHLDDTILRRVYRIGAVNVKHLVRDEIARFRQNYIYIDLSMSKRVASFRQLSNELCDFFELFCQGIVEKEIDKIFDILKEQ